MERETSIFLDVMMQTMNAYVFLYLLPCVVLDLLLSVYWTLFINDRCVYDVCLFLQKNVRYNRVVRLLYQKYEL